MRSESARISSSSSDTSSTAFPSSRTSTNLRCTYSIAPTSSPLVQRTPRRGSRDVLAADSDLAAARTPQAGQSVDQLGLAVAIHAGEADDLAGAHVERDTTHGAEAAVVEDAHVMDFEHGLTGR